MSLEFKLYKYQQRAVQSKATELLVGGSAGPGKSYFLRILSIVLALEVPGISVFLFRRLYKEILANHIYGAGGYLNLLKDLIDSGDVVYNKSDGLLTFYNGSRIFLCHAQYEDDVFTYLGTDMNVLLVDEATQFTEKMLRFLRTRVRLGGLEIPPEWKDLLPKIIYATNPGGPAHNYLKSGFVDFGAYTPIQAPDEDGGMLREFIPALYTDNLIQMRNDPHYAKRLQGIGDPKMVKAYLEGSWDILSDGIFSSVWDPKVHILEPFDIPYTWRIDRGYDYGSSAPGAIQYFAESDGSTVQLANGELFTFPERSIFIIGEIYLADKNRRGLELPPMEVAERILKYEFDEGLQGRVQPGPADNMIFNATPGFASIADIMAKRGVTFHRSDKTSGSRKKGIQFIKQMLHNAAQMRLERPHLYIFNNCYHTIRTLPNLPRDQKDQDDVDTTSEDHLFDVTRYRILKSVQAPRQAEVVGY